MQPQTLTNNAHNPTLLHDYERMHHAEGYINVELTPMMLCILQHYLFCFLFENPTFVFYVLLNLLACKIAQDATIVAKMTSPVVVVVVFVVVVVVVVVVELIYSSVYINAANPIAVML